MKKFLYPILLLPVHAFSEEAIQYHVHADVYSEPVSVHAFLNDWDSPNLQKGENAFAHGKMSLLAQKDNWTYGWVWSYDYQLHFSEDMARLYYQTQNEQQIDANTRYELSLEAQHVETLGARFAYDWQLNSNWNLVTGVTALLGRHYVDGNFKAVGQTLDKPELMDRVDWLNGYLDYSYDQPALKEDELGWDGKTNKGYGYAFDFSLQGKYKNWAAYISAEDVLGFLYWQNAPYTRYTLSYDQNSRPRIDLRGQLSKDKQYRQTIPYKIHSEITYFAESYPWSAGLSSFSNQYISLVQLNSYWQKEAYKFGVHVEPQTGAYGVSLLHSSWGLKYLTDDLKTNQAHRFQAYLYAQHHW